MLTHYDNFEGLANQDIGTRTPPLGGVVTPNPGTNLGQIIFDAAGGSKNINGTQGTYQYATALHTPGYHITWTVDYKTTDLTQNIGVIVAPTNAFASYIEVSFNFATGILKLDVNGTTSTFSPGFASDGTHTFELRAEITTGPAEQVSVLLDGAVVLQLTDTLGPGSRFLFVRMKGPATVGTDTILTSLFAQDLAAPPTKATSYLSPTLGIFSQYTPPVGLGTSSLRLEYPARSIVLKSLFADLAATWLNENTPPQLITQA